MHLDPRYLAYRWLRRRVKWAKQPDEHPQWAEFLGQRYHVTISPNGSYSGGRVKNPSGDRKNPEVVFSTAYKDPKFRQNVHDEFEQWKRRLEPRPRPKQSPEDMLAREDAVVDAVHEGEITGKDALGEDTLNDAYTVTIKNGDTEEKYIFKPSIGAAQKLHAEQGVWRARPGIDQGLQHVREEGAYRFDRMLGEGGVVPPTAARDEMDEETDGSYQQHVDATPLILGLDDLPKKITSEELTENPSFQRMQVMDLILGHEDRHAKNVMYYFDGEPSAESLKFVAIDNGLSQADPSETNSADDHVYVDAFSTWFDATDLGDDFKPSPDLATVQSGPISEDEWKDVPLSGQQAVENVLKDIPKQLQERLAKVKIGDFVREQLDSGVPPMAVQASAVRLAAMQSDPAIFGAFLEMTDFKMKDAWKEFQHMSGHMAQNLLDTAGAPDDTLAKIKEARGKHPHREPGRKSRGSSTPKVKVKGAARVSHPDIDKIAKRAQKNLQDILGDAHAKELYDRRADRDGEEFHMTVVTPPEMKKLVEAEMEKLQHQQARKPGEKPLSKTKARAAATEAIEKKIQEAMGEADWKSLGTGRAIQHGPDGNTWDNYSYHQVIDWPGGKKLRKELGLDPDHDFHITLGFKEEDIHGVDKSEDSIPDY